jgi:hypothetical protein
MLGGPRGTAILCAIRVVQANSLPTWEKPAKAASIALGVNEAGYEAPASTDNTFRWDASSQQYIYNWSTKGLEAGSSYRVGVKLDDGLTHYVNVGLR